MPPAQFILYAVAGYLGLGILIGPASLLWLGPRRDPALRGSPRRVLLILLPGAIAVWPMLLARWLPGGESRGSA